MGANLCILKKSSSSDDRNASGIEFLKPGRLKTDSKMNKKRRQLFQPDEKMTKTNKLTLEEWLRGSPESTPDYSNGSEVQVFRQSSKRVYPSSTSVHADSITAPKDRCSLERLVKINEVGEEKVQEPSVSRTQSGKLKKKVNFRLPQETDIIFYWAEERFEEWLEGNGKMLTPAPTFCSKWLITSWPVNVLGLVFVYSNKWVINYFLTCQCFRSGVCLFQ